MRFGFPALGGCRAAGIAFLCAAAAVQTARADLAISNVIVDFADPGRQTTDIEIENKGKERIYVVAEPAMVVGPGTKAERRIREADPEKLGLLVTPARTVLEPGERKLIRFLGVGDVGTQDKVYRVTVKPVVGKVTAPQTAVKVVFGYDVLVIRRPAGARPSLVAERQGGFIVFRNTGNTNVLLFDGKVCQQRCVPVETKRIYAGAEWRLRLPGPGKVTYKTEFGGKVEIREF